MYRKPGRSVIIISAATLLILLTSFSSVITRKQNKQKEKSLNILTIGDSNGALPFGWVHQLKQIRRNDTIFNISVLGNTIGFNNNEKSALNTLSNIGSHMDKAYAKLGKIDRIILMIGTNDCKAVFRDSLFVVPTNMKKLISEIKHIARSHRNKPLIYIVSPPPFGPDELVGEKYAGGMERISLLNKQLQVVAREESVSFINTCEILYPVFTNLTSDGVHLTADGQKMIALIIQENLKYRNP